MPRRTNRDPLPPALRLECEELMERLRPELERCVRSGHYLIALVACEDDALRLAGITSEFPAHQFAPVVELLKDNLDRERTRVETANNGR